MFINRPGKLTPVSQQQQKLSFRECLLQGDRTGFWCFWDHHLMRALEVGWTCRETAIGARWRSKLRFIWMHRCSVVLFFRLTHIYAVASVCFDYYSGVGVMPYVPSMHCPFLNVKTLFKHSHFCFCTSPHSLKWRRIMMNMLSCIRCTFYIRFPPSAMLTYVSFNCQFQ